MIKKTILIVDDTFENLYLLRVILEEAGYHVIEATNGCEGLKKLRENNPVDLIISDILMPVMDGFLFCQACKKEELFKNIPFVFYTSTYTEKLDEDFALKLGAVQFLRKPIDHDEVILTVKNIFGKESKPFKHVEQETITNEDVLKLYSERLINKLEQKGLDLEKEIEERKKAELEIQASEKSLIVAQKLAKVGSYNFDINAQIIARSASFNEIAGIDSNTALTFDVWRTITHPEDTPNNQKVFENCIKTGKKFDLEYRIITKNSKQLKWIHGIGEVIYSNGVATNFFGTIQDITDRKTAEIEIREAKDFSENLISSMQEGLSVVNLKGVHIDVNPALCNMTGFSREELIGKSAPFPYWPPEEHENILKQFRWPSEHFGLSKEVTFIRKNGEHFQALLASSGINDNHGNLTAFFATIKDITELKKAEIEIKAAKDFSENLILNLQEGLSVVSLGGVQLEANPALCKMIGFEREELIGKKEPFNYWPPEEYSKIRNAFSRTIEGEGNSFQLTLMRKSGERFPVMVSIASVKNNKGAIIANFATLRDISEKIKTQELLESIAEKSTERKNIIIELASYVGKDFKTALKKITMLSAKALDTEQASILEFHNNNTKLISRQFYNARNNVFEEGGTYYEKEYPEYFKIIQESISLNIQDAVNNPITKKLARVDFIPKGITSILDLPIQGIDSLYGVLCFDHIGDKRIFTTEEENFARSIAHLISLMVIDHQRKIAEQNLKIAQDFSKEIVLSLKDGLGIVNIKGELIEVNPEFCKMTGFSEKELIGSRAPFPYWPPEEIENIIKILSSTIDGNSEKVELNFMRKNGERFPVSISTSSIKNKQGAIVALFGIIEDITKQKNEQKLLEYSAKKSNLRKNAIIDLASLVGQDFNESLNKITSLSAKTLNVERVSVWKLNEDKTENYCRKLYKLKSDSFSSGLILKREDHPKYFKELEEKSIVSVNNAVNNVLTKTLAKDYLLPNNITSKMSIAVNGLDGLYGIICFEHVGKQRDWESDEEEFAISIANIVSVTIESAERKYAEGKIAMANIQLLEANEELNILRNQLEQENVYLRNEIDLVFNYEEMVYGSAAFSEVLTNVEKVAPTNATVLLLGESGTGKELLARAVHNISLRNKKPLIKVNCSAIPRELMESELFGHKKGSFTGAFNDKVGKFELANGGTLFLDEIGELPLDMQPKILRFLQEGEIEVVGGTGLKKLDVRVIAATNRNLKEEIEKKHFREDLYFRLNVFPIEIPPLRKRKEDIPLLVEHFIDKFNKAYAKNTKYIPDDSMNQLKSYSWPGNIRELENLIERASILSTSETLIIPGFESKTQKTKLPVKGNSLSLDLVQRNYILQILEQCNWKISGPNGAAVKLDLKPSTLRDKMTKLHITKPH